MLLQMAEERPIAVPAPPRPTPPPHAPVAWRRRAPGPPGASVAGWSDWGAAPHGPHAGPRPPPRGRGRRRAGVGYAAASGAPREPQPWTAVPGPSGGRKPDGHRQMGAP